jgi:anti-sigma B factor antagonist
MFSQRDSANDMSEGAQTSLSVCVRDHAACVRVAGRAKFNSATDFKKLIEQLQHDGCSEIVIDLSQCSVMDSTFLGILNSAGKKCDMARSQGRPCEIKLLRAPECVLESLANFEALHLFTVVKDAPPFDAFKRVEEGSTTRVELNRTCFEAHKSLMENSEDNERRFKDATEFFRKSLEDGEGKQ